jgi:hypothetical protein
MARARTGSGVRLPRRASRAARFAAFLASGLKVESLRQEFVAALPRLEVVGDGDDHKFLDLVAARQFEQAVGDVARRAEEGLVAGVGDVVELGLGVLVGLRFLGRGNATFGQPKARFQAPGPAAPAQVLSLFIGIGNGGGNADRRLGRFEDG